MNVDLLTTLEALANKYLHTCEGKVEKLIGSGGSAAVFKATKAGQEIALKVYDPKFLAGENGPSELKRIELQRQLIGKPCASLVDTFEVETAFDTCFIEMEFLPWPSLKEALAHVPVEAVESLVGCLVDAVRFLEDYGLVHRDIKPENILVHPEFTQLKVIDLGVIRRTDAEEDAADATDHGHRRPFIATAQYSSPEYLFRLEAPSPESWRALTIYQVGGVIHDLVTRRPIFDQEVQTQNKFAVAIAVLRRQPEFAPIPLPLLALAAVASKCLIKDPALRLKLVSWDMFQKIEKEPAASKLKKLAEVTHARKAAAREQERILAARIKQRRSGIEAISQRVKTALLASTQGEYKVTSYAQDEKTLPMQIALSSGERVYLQVTFGWARIDQAEVAVVTLAGALNAHPALDAESLPVGEFDADSANQALFDEVLLESVTKMIACASDVSATGIKPEKNDLAAILQNTK